MDYIVLNTNREKIYIIDDYVSAIWTERFDEAGDFEIIMRMNTSVLDFIKKDYYLTKEDTDRVMLIENIEITTDEEEGDRLKLTGRSMEIILNRRIVLEKTSFSATYDDDGNATFPNLQNGIRSLMNDNVIQPKISARQIPFIFATSDDANITKLTFEAQYYGENIYDIVTALCKEKHIGFKVTFASPDDGVNDRFQFALIAGVDRTYDQMENPHVVFSPENDNLYGGSYFNSNAIYRNVAIVAGEVEETEKINNDDGTETIKETRTVITVGTKIGLERREIFVDASDITRDVDEITTLSEPQYAAHLKQRGIDTLIENLEVEVFDGEISEIPMYEYGKDFFIGDKVQVVDTYGHEGKAYISEFISSCDAAGIKKYPTFITIEEGEYDYEQND